MNLQEKMKEFYFTLSHHNHNITITSIYDDCNNLLEQTMQDLKNDVAFQDISKNELLSTNTNHVNIKELYYKAKEYHKITKIEKASTLYKQIIYLEKYIKIDDNFERNRDYIHRSYLNLGTIYQDNKELVLAYYLYGKNVYTKNVRTDIYEASLVNFANIHDKENINSFFICNILEKYFKKNPNSTIVKNALISSYSKINRYEEANALLDKHQIPILPAIYESQEQINDIRKSFEKKLDQLLEQNTILSKDEIRSTNFFYFANHNKNNKNILTKLSNVYEKQLPSLCYTSNHCKKYKYRGKKIKIGFISNFFQSKHPVGKFINNTIIEFEKDKNFEVYIYTFSKDALKNKIKNHKMVIGALKEIRKLIAKEKLDIIIYPEIGMHSMTYFLAHARLAPVQCVLPGHPSTTGIKNIDYFLSHKYLETDTSQKNYSEKLIKLDNILSHYNKPKVIKEFLSKDELKLCKNSNNYLIPATLQKLHPNFDDILLEITKKDPKAKLIFFESNSKNNMDYFIKQRLLKNIDKNHISFRKWAKTNEFFSLLNHSDAVLEPIVFGFGTTIMEAFSIGTPIVTLPGNSIASRGGLLFYTKIDTLDLVAKNEKDYINLAVKLANNQDFRNNIKEKILKNNHLIYEKNDIVKELATFFKKALVNF